MQIGTVTRRNVVCTDTLSEAPTDSLRYGSNPVLAASCELRRFVRANYRRERRLVCDVKLGAGARAGMVPITQIGPKFAQRLYDNLLVGAIVKKRLTQAATCVRRVSRAAHGTR